MSNVNTFAVVESHTAKPAVARELVARTLRNDACYLECLPYLSPPGKTGSSQFDHCEVVNIVLAYDAKEVGAPILRYMVNNSMSKVQLWKVIERTLRGAGFEMARGRVVGVLEDKSDRANEVEQVESEEAVVAAA